MTKAITTIDDVLDVTLAKHCTGCGEPLAPVGGQCRACGELPGETREEARERLAADPHAIARAEARRLREEAAKLLVSAEHVFRMADQAEYRSELRQQRDVLQARLGEAARAQERALAGLGEALKAEKAAAGPLAEALGVHGRAVKAEETARRLRRGAEAETEAAVRLSAAVSVLARYQGEAAAAARAREGAELAVAGAGQAVRDRESERDRAQLMLERHAAVPLTRDTVFALAMPLFRMAMGADLEGRRLDQGERAMIGVFGDALRGAAFREFAGAAARADDERVRARMREEFLSQPRLQTLGPGSLGVSWVRPPQPSGAAPPGARVTPAPNLTPAGPFNRPAAGVPGVG